MIRRTPTTTKKKPQQNKRKKVLITCGPTWVAIDDVRIISNRSTGQMGHALVNECRKRRWDVTLLEGPVQNPLKNNSIRIRTFKWLDELEYLLRSELKNTYDVVIHAAAVADYRPERVMKKKIKSDSKTMTLNLIRTKKLIQFIKKWRKNIFLIGFKQETNLTPRTLKRHTSDLFELAQCDLVLANSLNAGRYHGFLLDESQQILVQAKTRQTMAKNLINEVNKRL